MCYDTLTERSKSSINNITTVGNVTNALQIGIDHSSQTQVANKSLYPALPLSQIQRQATGTIFGSCEYVNRSSGDRYVVTVSGECLYDSAGVS